MVASDDCYEVKPVDFRGLVHLAERIRERWLGSGEQQAVAWPRLQVGPGSGAAVARNLIDRRRGRAIIR
jgi:hypothetical protein